MFFGCVIKEINLNLKGYNIKVLLGLKRIEKQDKTKKQRKKLEN